MKIGPGIKGCTFGDTDHDSISASYGYDLAIDNVIAFIEKANIDPHPDQEANGYVFCGKCGSMTSI